jgi:hypothetical protein
MSLARPGSWIRRAEPGSDTIALIKTSVVVIGADAVRVIAAETIRAAVTKAVGDSSGSLSAGCDAI